jgi:hypothetical protein
MKKLFVLLSCYFLVHAFGSFSGKWGGDVVEIYLNGRQVHQQFMHADKSAKPLQLPSLRDNDKVEVFYSHCGTSGKGRKLVFKNDRNETVKTITFPDTENTRSRLPFLGKDIAGSKSNNLKIYYFSNELPKGCMLATLTVREGSVIAKTASL